MRPHHYIQKLMADALRANETLREAGVTVLEQNSQELAFLLKKPMRSEEHTSELQSPG